MKEFIISASHLLEFMYREASTDQKESMRKLTQEQNIEALEQAGFQTLESKIKEIAQGIEHETVH